MSSKPTKIDNTEEYNIQVSNNRIDKYNYKLTKEDEKEIILEYYISNSKQNIENIANKYNISRRYVYKLISKYKQNNQLDKIVEKTIAENRQKFSKRIDALLLKTIDRLNKEITDTSKDINISQLSTTLGILYDKNALEQGKATSNNAFSINIKIDK